ncbi:fungal-specific transcription factor [Emericellopsis atlantica]|uniref:Fungal-specific transcription factor n=1 Tax=Emericellopsis atlantica TaxID=2614577 RepID=A0A9P8CUN4_9HYPO|nr:fungal-specific transcription factor [Emericellopsis atlantica]KAG9259287.1 fungal-specific transcription factor [Emericellopsis atlantica]
MGAPDASSPYAQPPPSKRQRQSSLEEVGTTSTTTTTTATAAEQPSPHQSTDSKASASSNFRNVSACNRCRLRKNRCDQRLPSCASCAKANVACVGYDPITKKEIPRSYVFYLETRVEQLEGLLRDHGIDFPAAENLENCSRPAAKGEDGAGKDARPRNPAVETLSHQKRNPASASASAGGSAHSPAMQNISSKPKSLASASGVSFARVVFAAVQYSVSDQSGHPQDRRHPGGASGTSMRDSFFGLHTKPSIQPATFPSREVGMRLVTLYFEHANPQIPIMHRGEFMKMFEAAYAQPSQGLGPRESYVLNMVFAIGCGVIVGEPVKSETSRMAVDGGQCQPEEYHASAIVHLEACLSNSGGGLEVLQAVLLLANFALLRPVPPGLWYIIGVAVRLAVDLGLHREDGMDVEALPEGPLDGEVTDGNSTRPREGSAQERGRRQWIRDMRRRLWWCTYSFDRLVSTCVGRPFGISDQVITTDLPSILDDDYITPGGIMEPQNNEMLPSYKHVAHHYFRLRMLQSEILQVLQYQQSQIAKAGPQGTIYPEMHTHLPSPFLVQFDSFRSWRRSIDERLFNWKQSAPTRHETGVAFSTEFLELNYWQAIITLYRQSLSVPAMFEGEYNTSNEVDSPQGFTTAESREDEDKIYLKVAEAGQKILRIYRQLHLTGLVSYTYLSTHHLFMAGISYLYAIWHSHTVRSCLTMDEVDFTVLAAKSVFTDMIDKCPPAETCRDAFDRTARATIKMASSNGGFGAQASASMATAAAQRPRHHHRTQSTNWPSAVDPSTPTPQQSQHRGRPSEHQQQPFHFDLSLSDTLSSPPMSVQGGDVASKHSPALSQQAAAAARGYDNEYMMTSQDNHAVSPASSIKQEPNNSQRQPQPPPLRRLHSHPAGNNAFMGQQFGLQGSMDYPDTQTMDFLQSLGAAPNGGDMGSVDQAQVDLGFGINWEGLPNDYGDNQQMNPFDTFFFGAQQQGGGGPNGNMGL